MRGDWWSEWLLRYRSPDACPHKRRQQQLRLRVDAFGSAKLSTTNVEPPQRTSACATAILKAATAPVPPSRAPAYPAMQSLGAVESEDHPARQSPPTMLLGRPCRVLEADRIGDEEDCRLRDHLLAVHPKTVQ